MKKFITIALGASILLLIIIFGYQFSGKRTIGAIATASVLKDTSIVDEKEQEKEYTTEKLEKTETSNAVTAPAVTFPADHGAHTNFAAEWWYLNLFTKTRKADGTSTKYLGHLISFSRINGIKSLLHSRYDKTANTFKENTNTGGTLSVSLKNNTYLVVDYVNGASTKMKLEEFAPGSDRKRYYRLTGQTPNVGTFDLMLKERAVPVTGFTTPLLWGGTTGSCTGKISVFAPDDTYYYSIPNLDVFGTITDIDGTVRTVVAGKSWIDHQWFNGTPPTTWKGHYWNSFHFTEAADIYGSGTHQAVGFVTQIFTTGPKYTYWVWRKGNGTNECGTAGSFTVNNYGASGFPSSWSLDLKKTSLPFLTASGSAYSDNQIFTPPVGPSFTEPESGYTGTINGRPFTGVGFFETHRKSGM